MLWVVIWKDDSERKEDTDVCKLLGEEKKKVAEKEKEIGRLKGLIEEKKRRVDSESKKAAEACKLLEEEKKKASVKGEMARIEAEKAVKYSFQIGQLEKQVNEAKTKLAFEISTFREATPPLSLAGDSLSLSSLSSIFRF